MQRGSGLCTYCTNVRGVEKRKEGKLLVKYTDKEPILMQKLP